MSESVKDYPPYLDYPKPKKKQTNADRIRAMTDEEMADELSYPGCHKQSTPEICRKYTGNCKECWIDWLKQEVSK